MPITRRIFVLSGIGAALSACVQNGGEGITAEPTGGDPSAFSGAYGALPNEKYPIPAVNLKQLKPKWRRQIVDYPTTEIPGTIIVDIPTRLVYLVQENGKALRYGVGIGRDGFTWGGRGVIQYKREWPRWTPPSEMIDRQPELEKYRTGMEPGLDNPLGARALYIFQNGQDTLYRLHGTSDPTSIGKAVSSGCVRFMNQDIIDLYNRVRPGVTIVVQQAPGTDVSMLHTH